MSELAFALATRGDDAGIRHLLATNAMPGRIRLRFEREPDYFSGCGAMGPFTQVLVARAGERVVGLACRAVRPMFVAGRRENVGYLGQLRIHPQYRGRSLVARGFRLLRELNGDGRARGYVTTIVEGNAEAEGVLVHRRRRSMPRYRFVDTLVTLTLPVPRAAGRMPALPETWSAATPAFSRLATSFLGGLKAAAPLLSAPSLETPASSRPRESDIRTFLETHGSRRNFFPIFESTPGLDAGDFVAVFRGGEPAGVAALWDQHAYKQTVIDGYDRLLGAARPLVNAAAALRGRPTLPRPGSALRMAYGSFFCAAGNDRGVARELIARLLRLAGERGYAHLVLGFAEKDPLLGPARAFRHVAYRSGIYTVSWEEGDDFHDRLGDRPAYLELATL